MSSLDWFFTALPLLIVTVVALYARRYVRSVADFLTGGRVAGRYVVAVSDWQAALGLITVIGTFEMLYRTGTAVGFWGVVATPVMLLVTLTGFAFYRYRETRVMTMGQFFETRYSRSFRLFASGLQCLAGVINYGIFPAVGARFLIYYADLPLSFEWLGFTWPTFQVVMAIFLSAAVLVACLGGQITVMVSDCVMGLLSYPIYLIVAVSLMLSFSWFGQIIPPLLDPPSGMSRLNPFNVHEWRDFNLFYTIVGVMGGVYSLLSWSANQGYNAAAVNPHEQKMGRILGTWRGGFSNLMFAFIVLSAFTYMHHADFHKEARQTEAALEYKAYRDLAPTGFPEVADPENLESVREAVAGMPAENQQMHNTIKYQMLVPVVLREMLPVGVIGLFCALMIFLMMSTDTTYVHAWGSIIIQDLYLPLRGRPLPVRRQLALLRAAIVAVAVFAFFFSIHFNQVTYILMFFALTGSVYLGGAGAVIIGGLYWNRGTTAGAWAAMLTGSSMAAGGFIGQQLWVGRIYPALAENELLLHWTTWLLEGVSRPFEPIILWRVTPDAFPINGQEIYFLTMVFAITAYVVVSLLTCRKPFNMDKLLHRGEYHVRDVVEAADTAITKKRGIVARIIGIDEEFSRGDRILSWSVFYYSFVWGVGVWLIIILWNVLLFHWPDMWFARWGFFSNYIVNMAIGVVTTVWFCWGCTRDLRRMFQRLQEREIDPNDDGLVRKD